MTGPEPCVFCVIANDDPHGQVLADYGRVVVFAPLEPVTPGHVLVVPKLHVADALVHAGVTAETFGVASKYADHCSSDVGTDDFNLITNVGRLATQSVFHLHVHVVPRRRGDALPLPWSKVRPERVFAALQASPIEVASEELLEDAVFAITEELNRRGPV